MYKGYKIICVTPAGRKRYMKLLAPYVISSENVDRWDIWINTKDSNDIYFLEKLSNLFPKKIKLVPQPEGKIEGNKSIGAFFRFCTEEDTIYIRFDDDIVWIEDNFFKKLLEKRLKYREYFLIFPLIINNAICTHLLSVNKKISIDNSFYITAHSSDKIAWENPKFAEELHNFFLTILKRKELEKLYIHDVPIALNRFSINCISWFGEDFKKFNGKVFGDEEEYLTVIKPQELGKTNLIIGNAIISHFAFYTQREYLDKTDILSKYEEIILSSNGKIKDLYLEISKIENINTTKNLKIRVSKNNLKRIIANIPLPIIKITTLGQIYKTIRLKFKKIIKY